MSIILSFKRTFKQFTEFLKKYPENFGKIILTLYEAFICFTKQNNLHIFFYYDNKTFGIFQFPTDFLVKIITTRLTGGLHQGYKPKSPASA